MYSYQAEKANIFTEQGQVMYNNIRDRVKILLGQAGAVSMGKLFTSAVTGSSWTAMACVDRMVELRELREITGPEACGQDRVFVEY